MEVSDQRHTNTAARIVKVTVEQIRLLGYQQVSLRQVAKLAGVAPTTIYKHFRNKQDLLKSALEVASQQLAGKFQGPKNDPDVTVMLTKLGVKIIQEMQTNANLMTFVFFSPAALQLFSEQNNGLTQYQIYQTTTNLIKQLIIQENLQVTSQSLFIQLWSFIQGYSQLTQAQVLPLSEKVVSQTLKTLIRGYQK